MNRIFTEEELTSHAFAFEESLSALRGAVPGQDADSSVIEVTAGSCPVLLVSVHGVPHLRGSSWKKREPFTAAIAEEVRLLVDSSVFLLKGVLAEDGNFDSGGYVKQRLATAVQQIAPLLVLDIHGADVSRSFDVAIGTRQGTSLRGRSELLGVVETSLKARGLNVEVVGTGMFSAGHPRSICAYVSKHLGVPALQLEINRDLRRPHAGAHAYHTLVVALAEAVEAVAMSARQAARRSKPSDSKDRRAR